MKKFFQIRPWMVASIRIISPAGVLTLQLCMLGISSGLSHLGSVMVISTGIGPTREPIYTMLCYRGYCFIYWIPRCRLYDYWNTRGYCVSSKARTIDLFWKNLYDKISNDSTAQTSEVTRFNNAVIEELRVSRSSWLRHSPGTPFSQDKLVEIQHRIEDQTFRFDENSLFRSVPDLLKILVGKDLPTAKDYLIEKGLSKKDSYYIMVLGDYTLEAVIIHVLGSVFNPMKDLSVVRVSTLIQQMDRTVRIQAHHLDLKKAAVGLKKAAGMEDKMEDKPKKDDKVTRANYAIGVGMVELLVERRVITLESDLSYTDVIPVSKIKGYVRTSCYAIFNLDLSILPIRVNLPMVCEPLPWTSKVDEPASLADMEGGYLCGLTGELYNRLRLLSSRSYSHFYIKLQNPQRVCAVLNTMQSQGFEINSHVLEFILENRETLEEEGLLVNRCLAKGNILEVSRLLRDSYFNKNDFGIQELRSFNYLLKELITRVQRARYEDFILTMASAYKGYRFYLPGFMDFRGRIYRAGVLHFHERDLARSLIVFAYDGHSESPSQLRRQLACAAAFKYQKFVSIEQSMSWYHEHQSDMRGSPKNLIEFAKGASDPFQFLAKVLPNDGVVHTVPVTQDASASAYQIMSYMLLNQEMARRTNLIPSPSNEIQDLYLELREELLVFLQERFNTMEYAQVESRLTRKLVKQMFMPLIYGKSVRTMVGDIREVYGQSLVSKDHYRLATLCHEFWTNKYPDVANLMRLLNLIGWIFTVSDKPVQYRVPYFTTVQDYIRSVKADIYVYERLSHKRRKVTLLVPTLDRDSRKTQTATCVNFIHQRDAFIAMKVVEELGLQMKAPVYTVHDNFITTAAFAASVPYIYTKVFMEMGPPLRLINDFIYMNLLGEGCDKAPLDYPIPGEELRTILMDIKPKGSQFQSKWNLKIEETIKLYELYVHTVGGMRHAEKWNEFNSALQSWESLGFNYSVHY